MAAARLERLLNLAAALMNAERPLTAEMIREQVAGYEGSAGETFRKQFERDKSALRNLGIPIVAERAVNESIDTYRVAREELYLRDPGLAADELAALQLAARVVEIRGLDDADALWKLGATGDAADLGDDTPAAPAAIVPVDDTLTSLFGAIDAGSSVRFEYADRERHVQPLRLSFRNGHWYVVAYDPTARADRSYRVDRIRSTIRHDAPLERPADAGAPADTQRFARPWELGDGDPIRAEVRIDGPQAEWTRPRLGSDAVVANHDDGSVTFRFDVRNRDAFRGFVVELLDHAVVEGPAELRDDLVTWLESIISGDGVATS